MGSSDQTSPPTDKGLHGKEHVLVAAGWGSAPSDLAAAVGCQEPTISRRIRSGVSVASTGV